MEVGAEGTGLRLVLWHMGVFVTYYRVEEEWEEKKKNKCWKQLVYDLLILFTFEPKITYGPYIEVFRVESMHP